MKVQIMRGNEIISDSSKKQVAKVIEPLVEKPRMSVNITNVPKDSIFNKIADEVDDFANHVDEVIKDTRVAAPVMDDLVYRGNGEPDPVPLENAEEENVSITDLLSEEDRKTISETVETINNAESEEDEYSDEEEAYDEYDEDEDEEDYEQYLSNRDRKQNRQIEKQNRRTDYDGF